MPVRAALLARARDHHHSVTLARASRTMAADIIPTHIFTYGTLRDDDDSGAPVCTDLSTCTSSLTSPTVAAVDGALRTGMHWPQRAR